MVSRRILYNITGLVIVYGLLGCFLGGNCNWQNPPPDKIFDVYFAVASVNDPGNWHSSCQYKPSNDFYRDFVDNNGNRDLNKLVNISYNSSGNKYWFEYGGDGKSYCLDDDTWSTPYCQNKLELKAINTSHPQTIWVNLNSQCHQCGNHPSYSATWWKFEKNFRAKTLTPCDNASITLAIQSNNVTCTTGTPFGCGSGEVQD